jgi:hypothetical protein
LFEETFHAADYDKNKLDLNNPTCMDEARAWKFATKAPGTSFNIKTTDPQGNISFDRSLAGSISDMTHSALARTFKYGGTPAEGRTLITRNGGKGLYQNLPLK